MSSVSLHGLCFGYRGGFQLGPLDLELAAGGSTALVGPSGAGKSTLLRCLAGLEQPSAGTIHFGDREVSSPRHVLAPHQRRVGFVFQSGALWPHLTALGHLRFAAPNREREALVALLERVGLGDKLNRRPARLSGGEAQRLALARALAGAPKLLLLDEPLRSLDVHLRDEMALLIRETASERGLTVVLVTHDREEALSIADHLVVLRDGAVVETGPALDLLRRPSSTFTARFLCRAACLPAQGGHGEMVETPFGPLPRPPDSRGELTLVVLPGDVEEALGEAERACPQGRVLRVEPATDGVLATVELQGEVLRASCRSAPTVGSRLPLRLCRTPRLLPAKTEARP